MVAAAEAAKAPAEAAVVTRLGFHLFWVLGGVMEGEG